MRSIVAGFFLLTFLQNSFAQEGEPQELAAFLKANNLPTDTIEQILEQELEDPHSLKGATFLSPSQALKSSMIEIGTIQHQLKRLNHTRKAIGISALLATAGVVAMIAPLPGTQAIGVVLLKQGVAVGATALAVAGGGAYTLGAISEIRSIKDIKLVIQTTLNEILKETPVGRAIGTIEKIKLSKKWGIKKFHTSEGYDFRARTIKIQTDSGVREEVVFVSYTAWNRYRSLQRWTGTLKEIYNEKVISLFDLLLYPFEKYKRLRVLEESEDLTTLEKLEYARIVARQILGAISFREVGETLNIDVDTFREVYFELDEITLENVSESEVIRILDTLLGMRERL